MGQIANQIKSVSFTRVEDGTAEEYAFLSLYTKNAAMACRTDCWNF